MNNKLQEINDKSDGLQNVIVDIEPRSKEIIRRAKLRVLILGPGVKGGDLYIKRCQIRDELRQRGHVAHFCEEMWTLDRLQASGLNLTTAEFIQLELYDYIVCLMTSPGTIGEVHDFAKKPKFASKMMICIDRSHRSGYSAQGVIKIFEGLHGKVDWYNYPGDITKCHLTTRIVEQLEKVSYAKQYLIIAGGD